MIRNLTVPPRFSLVAVVYSHGWYQCLPFRWDATARVLSRVEWLPDGGIARLRLSQPDAASLRVAVDSPSAPSTAETGLLLDRVRAMLHLDHDLGDFYERCARHPVLRPVPLVGGGRPLRASSLFENVVKAICWTNTRWERAAAMMNRLARLGDPYPGEADLFAFPRPEQILAAGEPRLRDEVRLGYRVHPVLEASHLALTGDLNDDLVDEGVASDQLRATLQRLPGIGPAAATFLSILYGRYDRVLVGRAAAAFAAETYFDGRRPSEAEIRALWEPFGPWKGLAAFTANMLWWAKGEPEIAGALGLPG